MSPCPVCSRARSRLPQRTSRAGHGRPTPLHPPVATSPTGRLSSELRKRGELVDRAAGLAADARADAVCALVGLLASPNHAVRLGACKALVGTVLQLREATELEERVVALEDVAHGVEAGAQLRRVQ